MLKEIRATATAGIYSEVMNQIYDSFDKRIREAISNASDAQATRVTISVFLGEHPKMIIRDNGHGMTPEEVVTKYVSMGGGEKYCDDESIGRIGIGALSIFAIGKVVSISTRRRGDSFVTVAELDFSQLQRSAAHAVPLEQIVLGHVKGQRPSSDEDEEQFTEITITELDKNVVEIFNDERKVKDTIETLERILPVPYRSDDPVFEKLNAEIADRLVSQNHIAEVVLHIPHLGLTNPGYTIRRKTIESVENVKIVNYLPIFPFTIQGGSRSDLSVCGYLFINGGGVLPKGWQGINTRVKNVTIEKGTYFGCAVDPASRNRIGGELIISNIDENRAITTNRSGFATESVDYKLVSEYMVGRIDHATDIIRKHSAIESIVKKYVSALDRVRLVMENNAKVQDERGDGEEFKELDDRDVQLDETSKYCLEMDLREEMDRIQVEFELIFSPVMEGNFYVWPHEDHFYSIYVHEKLKSFNYNVAGKMVDYCVVYCGESKPLLAKKPGRVFLNLDSKLVRNKDITRVDVGLVETMLTLYLNYLRCGGDAGVLYYQTIEDLLSV